MIVYFLLFFFEILHLTSSALHLALPSPQKTMHFYKMKLFKMNPEIFQPFN